MQTPNITCPGCGTEFADIRGPTHAYIESSPGCWAAYGEVLAREYSDPTLLEVHRLSVDAYAIQHPGIPSRQSIQSVGFHLARLLLQIEHGLSAEKTNTAMTVLARYKHEFVWLEPPKLRGVLTVASVLPHVHPEEHKAAVRAWAESAWSAWAVHKTTLKRWVAMAK